MDFEKQGSWSDSQWPMEKQQQIRAASVEAASEKGLALPAAAEGETAFPLQRFEEQQTWERTDEMGVEKQQATSSVTEVFSSDKIFPASESPAGEKSFASQQYEQSLPWRGTQGGPESSSLTVGALEGTEAAPLVQLQGPSNSLETWAISRAATIAAAAGLPHLLIGVVLADGSVWGIDDLRGELLQALQYSSLLQQSLTMSELQQQQLLLDQQQMLQLQRAQQHLQQQQELQQLQQQQLQQQPSFPMLQQQPQQEGQWTEMYSALPRRLQQNAAAGSPFPSLNPGVSQAASVGLGSGSTRADPTLLLPHRLQQRLQQQLLQVQQQRCPAGSPPGSCAAVGGEADAAGAVHQMLPILNWRLSRQVVSYRVSVSTPDGGFHEVEVTPEEMGRLLQGAQLLLEFESATESHVKTHAGVGHPTYASDGAAQAKKEAELKDGAREEQQPPKRTDFPSPVQDQHPQPSLPMAIPLSDQRGTTYITDNSSSGASHAGDRTGSLPSTPTDPQRTTSPNAHFADSSVGRPSTVAGPPQADASIGASPTSSSVGTRGTNPAPMIQQSSSRSGALQSAPSQGAAPAAHPIAMSATNPPVGALPSSSSLGVTSSNPSIGAPIGVTSSSPSIGAPSRDSSTPSLGASSPTPAIESHATGISQTPATSPSPLPHNDVSLANLGGSGTLGSLGASGGSLALWLAIAQGLARDQALQQQAENLLLQQYGISPQPSVGPVTAGNSPALGTLGTSQGVAATP